MSDPADTATLILKALRGPEWKAPASVRLRRLLKAALRVYGFRAVEVRNPTIDELTLLPTEATRKEGAP